MVRGPVSRRTSSSRSSPWLPRTSSRRNRSWLCHWLSVKSYTPERPSPKSRVAMVVVAGAGCASSVHPSRSSGCTSGAVVRVACTRTGRRPAPRKPRISDTAWYWCVDETCTWVGAPIAPERTRASRAACEGISRYCSATCTSALAPTSDHSDRRPARSGAGGVSASTGTPAADGGADHLGRRRPRDRGDHEVRAGPADAVVQRRVRRDLEVPGGPHHRAHAVESLEPGGGPPEVARPPARPDHGEACGHQKKCPTRMPSTNQASPPRTPKTTGLFIAIFAG